MNRFKNWLHCTALVLSLSVVASERWSRQVPQHGFLAHQINDWVPVQSQFAGSDRSSRFAQFPTSNAFGVNSFASPAQAQYNPFTTSQKFGFGGPPQAQPLLQQQAVLTPQQLQSVEGATGQETPVELLYAPLETLQKQGFQGGNENRYSVVPPNVNAALINNFYESGTVEPVSKSRFQQPITTTTSRPVSERHNPFQSTVAKSTLKPYQPPLAMFLLSEGSNRVNVNDVLSVLKSANTIDVLDAPSEKRPNVFIGPSDMTPPPGYSKFELPYLSHLDAQRTGRKIENLPFFVAPLSYHTPDGFGKIPLPAPHVGSVVVNTPLSIKQEEAQFFGHNQLNQGAVKQQSSRFGFNQDKFNNNQQFVSSTHAPAAVNRFNSNHFGGSSTVNPTTRQPVTSRPSSTFNDLREEHFNTEKQRVPVNRHPQQQPFGQFSSQPTKTRPTQTRPTQYLEEVTETPLPETQFSSFESSTTQKPTQHRRPTSAQTAQSSISYQTAPSRNPSSHSQFFEESFQSPSTTGRPSTNYFSGFASSNPFSDQQFVHKFKLVESVKPDYKDSKDDFFNSFNTNSNSNSNPFSNFGNTYSTIKAFSPPPAPVQTPEKQRFQSFPSSTARPTQKRPTASTTFQFTPSSVRPVSEEVEVTTIEPVVSFSPTSSVFQSTFDFNGQSPASIHQQNILETTKLSYDPYKVPSTEKSIPVRGGANSNYRQPSSKAPLPSTDAPNNFAFQSSRRPAPQPERHQPAFNDGAFVNRFNNQQFASRPTTSDFSSSAFDSRQPQSRPTKVTSTSLSSQDQPSTFFSSEDLTSTRARPSTTARPQTVSTTRRPVEQHRGSHQRGTRPTNIVTEGQFYQPEQHQEQLFQRRPTSERPPPPPRPTTTTTLRPQELSYEITGAPEVNVVNHNVHEVQKDHIQLTHPSSQAVSEPSLYENSPSETPISSTDAPTYNTPSDLPAISPMLPGLINSLTEDKWMEPKEEVTTTTTTRRPFIRGRRPLPGRERETGTSSSTRAQPSSSEAGSSSTRTTSNTSTGTRSRRPLTTRYNKTSTDSSSTTGQASSSSTAGTAPGTTGTRSQVIRNNRVRYNPTNEERNRLRVSRVRPGAGPGAAKESVKYEKDESIDYQRDVLNQNYPSIKPRVTQAPVTTTFTPTTTTTTEVPTRETEQEQNVITADHEVIYQQERVPVNHATNYRAETEQRLPDPTRKYPGLFNGLQEEMILPEEHRTTLYEEQEIVTEPVLDQRKSIFKQKARLNPVFTTSRPISSRLTTTTDVPSVETTTVRRRSNFPRRQRPLSTTQQPGTTETSSSDETTAKPTRHQPSRGGLRIRERRPLNDQTTTGVPPTEVSSRRSFQSRGNQNEVSEDGAVTARRQNFPSRTNADRELKQVVNDPTLSARGRQRSRFRLEQQESQWSVPSRVTDQNNSQENDLSDENEPEIVTADPLLEKEENSVATESEPSEERKVVKIYKRRRPESTTEEVVSEDAKDENSETDEKKPELKKGNNKRRGYWKKVRVRPLDTFETAESQHIGKHYLNTLIPSQDSKYNGDKAIPLKKSPSEDEPKVTTFAPEVPEEEVKELNKDDAVHNNSEEEVTTVVPTESQNEEEVAITTIIPETLQEVVTEDDASMFDEVRKSLKDLFGMTDEEEAEANAANTTIMPEIEEITTTVPEEIVTTVAPTVESVVVTTNDNTPSDPMGSLVLATSTSRHISQETEICYRGRCIRTDKKLEK